MEQHARDSTPRDYRTTPADSYWNNALQMEADGGKDNTNNLQRLADVNNAPIIVALSVMHDNNTGYVITGSRQKIKSGKFAKHNVNLVQEELWPQLSVLKKYTKCTTFDQLDYEAFVAGETRTILLMKDTALALGRLQLLSQLSHWYCSCKKSS